MSEWKKVFESNVSLYCRIIIQYLIKSGWKYISIDNYTKKMPDFPVKEAVLSKSYKKEGSFPIVSQSKDLISGFSDDEQLLNKISTPIIIFGDHTQVVKYIDFDFVLGADGTKILTVTNDYNPKFFYYLIKSIDLHSNKYARHYSKLRKEIIPFQENSLSIQSKIVSFLDSMENNIISNESYFDKETEQKILSLQKTSMSVQLIKDEIESQKNYIKLLRQNILQDAIEGKLTADLPCRQAGWRNPNFRNLSGKTVPKISDKFFTYVLECDDGSLYKGFSQNLFERINRHLDGHGAEWTQRHKPIALIHFEEFKTEKEAVEREKYFKSGSGREYINKIRNENKQNYDAEALFEQIQKERNNEKKQKELSPITDEEKPFEIPEEWKWVRLGKIVYNITSGSREWAKYYSDKGAIFLRMGNLSRNSYKLRLDNLQYVYVPETAEGKRTRLMPFDLLFSITAEIGNLGLIPEKFPEAYINQHTARIRFVDCIKQSLFFANSLLAPAIRKQYMPNTHGMKNSFRLDTLSYLLIPLPSLEEQKEIVKLVEKHLQTVSDLENQITDREQLTKQLMQSILKDAFKEK